MTIQQHLKQASSVEGDVGELNPKAPGVSVHATAERVAKVLFDHAKPPDPSKRIIKKPRNR